MIFVHLQCNIIISDTLLIHNIIMINDRRMEEIMRALAKNANIEQKSGTLEQAGTRYGFGRNSMRKIAEDAGAVIKIGKSVRVNFSILDKYMDALSGK